jgi:GAF domain-containing protein
LPEVIETCRAARRELLDVSANPRGDRRGTAAITTALAGSADAADLGAALSAASADLGVDVIGLSTLSHDGFLHEITSTGAEVDPQGYAIADYPATKAALETATMLEAHVRDPLIDPAERAILIRDGLASLLLTPVIDAGVPLGILEFSNYSHHQWTRRDIAQARTVAEHLASALRRMNESDSMNRARRISV